ADPPAFELAIGLGNPFEIPPECLQSRLLNRRVTLYTQEYVARGLDGVEQHVADRCEGRVVVRITRTRRRASRHGRKRCTRATEYSLEPALSLIEVRDMVARVVHHGHPEVALVVPIGAARVLGDRHFRFHLTSS